MRECAAGAGASCGCGERALLLAAGCAAMLTLVPVALHQLGALSHVPDPPGRVFDSDRITESRMGWRLKFCGVLPIGEECALSSAPGFVGASPLRPCRRSYFARQFLVRRQSPLSAELQL